jgi:hypothetical protein
MIEALIVVVILIIAGAPTWGWLGFGLLALYVVYANA